MPGVPSLLPRLIVALALPALLAATQSGCSPIGLGIGAAAAVGVVAAQERDMAEAARDLAIQAQINEKLLEKDLTLFGRTGITVVEGRVLMTGAIRNPDFIPEVTQIAWSVPGVREVFNELTVFTGDRSVDFGKDPVINAKVRAAIIRDRAIDDVNYTIDVSRGTVFLMGVAQSPAEIERVISYARDVEGVRRVISYVLPKDDPRRPRR